MTDLPPERMFLAMILMGVAMAALFFTLSAATEAVKTALLWVDDRKPEGPWPMMTLIGTLCGYEYSDSYERFQKEGKEDIRGADLLARSCVVVGAIPMAICVTVNFYPIVLSLALLYAIAHTARFARRHKKLFDKHIKDPEAHK